MLPRLVLLSILAICFSCRENTVDQSESNKVSVLSYENDIPEIFKAVQTGGVFKDSKTFVDCIPKFSIEEIRKNFRAAHVDQSIDLDLFVKQNFIIPDARNSGFQSDSTKSIVQHIEALWPFLQRQPDSKSGTLLPLPHPYIVPGGRFGEIYYWDSYFTMLGLQVSKKDSIIASMIDNFAYLIDTYGHIPNGNRSYYLTRSQPPFFASMVDLLQESRPDDKILAHYLPQLEKEYLYWMGNFDILKTKQKQLGKTVITDAGHLLNRYYDVGNAPRPEAYKEDVETAKQAQEADTTVYRHLRSGAESGWDYSSRWFRDGRNLATIHTTEILPVDLNALLYNLELVLARSFEQAGNAVKSQEYQAYATKRKEAFDTYFWNENAGFYMDFDFVSRNQTSVMSLAGIYPLFYQLANQEQADRVAEVIEAKFLQAGGLTTTLQFTGQQWDAPNGWAPLQWLAIKGLENYGHHDLAAEIAKRWLANNERVYKNTLKMVEKYNVYDISLEAGGGEYPVQDGFGWSNGVYLKLKQMYGDAD